MLPFFKKLLGIKEVAKPVEEPKSAVNLVKKVEHIDMQYTMSIAFNVQHNSDENTIDVAVSALMFQGNNERAADFMYKSDPADIQNVMLVLAKMAGQHIMNTDPAVYDKACIAEHLKPTDPKDLN